MQRGEHQIDGHAERTTREIDGMVKCFEAALQHPVRILPHGSHPVMQWVEEYTAVLLSSSHILNDNTARYNTLHGQRAQ